MLDPAVYGPEQRQHAVPGGGRALEWVLAVAVSALLQLATERARGERLRVTRVVDRQEAALLGDKQEHQAHHHRDRAAVDLGALQILQQLAMAIAVLQVERRDQQLNGTPDLGAELVGDLLLFAGALLQQRREAVLDGQREEPPGAEQRRERSQRDGLLEPQLRAPRARAGRLALTGPHERPPGPVGDERERHVACTRQLGGTVDRARRPRFTGDRAVERRAGLDAVNEQHSRGTVTRVIAHHIRRPERDRLLGDKVAGISIGRLVHGVAQLQDLVEHPPDPPLLQAVILAPLGESDPEVGQRSRGGVEPIGQRPLQRRDGEERAAGLDQRQPLGMVVLDPCATASHYRRAPSGTNSVIAAGNKRGAGSA